MSPGRREELAAAGALGILPRKENTPAMREPEPFAPERAQAMWDRAAGIVERYLQRLDRSELAADPSEPKALYDQWRVLSLAISALKRIQEGRLQSLLEAERERQRTAEGNDLAEEHARELDALFARMQGAGGGDGEDEDA